MPQGSPRNSVHLKEIRTPLSNMFLWRKNLEGVYIASTQECSKLFGFKNIHQMLGKTDYDIPCKMVNFAEVFRTEDKKVMSFRKAKKYIEIQPCAKDEWKILFVNKAPLFNSEENVIGTDASAIDITCLFNKINNLIENISRIRSKFSRIPRCYTVGNNTHISISQRQLECLFFLLRGKTAKEIAKQLKLSPRTVEYYIELLKIKFNCQNKSELIEKSIVEGFNYVIPEQLFQTQLSMSLDE